MSKAINWQQQNSGFAIDAEGMSYRKLNSLLREQLPENGNKRRFQLYNVRGQRYIGEGLNAKVEIIIEGVAGNDLAAFAEDVDIRVYGNVQDGVANTMGSGKIVVHGSAGDILGYSMRGGSVIILGDAGYRAGIHMKGYQHKQPNIVIGGSAGDFLGEYMAGGRIVVLGLNSTRDKIVGNNLGAGMHGGKIYIRDQVSQHKICQSVQAAPLNPEDKEELQQLIQQFSQQLERDITDISLENFSKIAPVSHRPYGNLYTSFQ